MGHAKGKRVLGDQKRHRNAEEGTPARVNQHDVVNGAGHIMVSNTEPTVGQVRNGCRDRNDAECGRRHAGNDICRSSINLPVLGHIEWPGSWVVARPFSAWSPGCGVVARQVPKAEPGSSKVVRRAEEDLS